MKTFQISTRILACSNKFIRYCSSCIVSTLSLLIPRNMVPVEYHSSFESLRMLVVELSCTFLFCDVRTSFKLYNILSSSISTSNFSSSFSGFKQCQILNNVLRSVAFLLLLHPFCFLENKGKQSVLVYKSTKGDLCFNTYHFFYEHM